MLWQFSVVFSNNLIIFGNVISFNELDMTESPSSLREDIRNKGHRRWFSPPTQGT